jgi:site-specific DNA recombinase
MERVGDHGSLKRHNGIILNDLYAGKIVWNKVRMVKDPDTGKRVSRANPVEEWQSVDASHLRIVEPDIYEAALATKRERGGSRPHLVRKPKRVLSGLLRCGVCGGGMSGNQGRLQCTRRRETGTCNHSRAYNVEVIERTVFEGLKKHLTDPALIAEYVKAYNAERSRLAATLGANVGRIEKRLAAGKREMDRLIDLYTKGLVEEAEVQARLPALRAEQQLEADLGGADRPPNVVSLHPATIERYKSQIADLSAALAGKDGMEEEAVVAFRKLIQQ